MAFSSSSHSPPFLTPTKIRPHCLRSDPSVIGFPNRFLNFQISRHRKSVHFASIAERTLEASSSSSWIPPDGNSSDGYGGWLFVEMPIEKKKRELPMFLFSGVAASIAIVLAAVAHRSFSSKGFKYRFNAPLHALQELFTPAHSKVPAIRIASADVSETIPEDKSSMGHRASDTAEEDCLSGEKQERIIIPVAPDSTQQEALSVMKKLKIIDDDVKPEELCTRREYARWLVRVNSLLERNPKHQIVPSMLIAGSTVTAFDDVSVGDPDLWSIQALAEAGVVASKLSVKHSSFQDMDGSKDQGRVVFLPESFISRMDLVDWRAKLDYPRMAGIEEKMLRKKVGFMDVAPDASPELLMDLLGGDRSIARKVFGNSRRLQPRKPATKAQAAVALTSGRMAEAIRTELLRLEAENSSRQAEMEEIRSEILGRGEIQRFWEEKLNEERARGLEVEGDFHAAMHDLEKEKTVRDESLADFLKEKAALDCQRQLLSRLEEEINEMRERLAAERANFVAEQLSSGQLLVDLQAKQEAMVEAKSILQAEKEALRILRSWVENEARRIKERAKVLEEAGRRWKWDAR
ncbi:uncharacterized protein LOC131234467 isoform X2 [Magnolia sinica]|uniref:uncharacterized protein LOC131234467 isoform X2 n=1 Tax=Magnolia sinica TaxID=86752 RepID=UPI0026593BFC|nr:uncharacterized protein LOC131234467 isoform X2 [Magnolia sinica]